ncbi:MAG: hypothetical protein D5S00_06200 [Tindallia sp. MSAO_Bac2]|nr:MAG: hypothetical protein D5S00_06200 [Tindallia sp. MSAO_Bac2]
MTATDMFVVSEGFVDSTHGSLGCITCHEGENIADKDIAHAGMIKYPSSDLDGICYQCHAGVTETFQYSLHRNLTGMKNGLMAFTNESSLSDSPHHEETFNKNCIDCHASCGDCHVSRPKVYTGGLIDGHNFFGTPPMDQTCYGCHGARNAGEFMGDVGFRGDIHYEAGMTCMDCHDISNFHGTGVEYASMWDKAELPSCLECHEGATPGESDLQVHNIHGDSLSCQVCHAQANNNCFECHVEYNEDETALASSSTVRTMFRIGLNPIQSEERPYEYVTLRHIPTSVNSFEVVGPDMLPNFDEIPNWKYSPTHNIQRVTFQNESCDACHGNEGIFLKEDDLLESDSKANWDLIPDVPQ